jgi:cellulose synthase/poly-beta-1,6-N-acetylglucosamine synthase-like glycosyltransferase
MSVVLGVLIVFMSLALGTIAVLTVSWMLYAWRTPEGLVQTSFVRHSPEPVTPLSFSLIVPARHEDQVLGHTLDTLAALRHRDVQIICVVGHDDPVTAAVAEAAAARHPDCVQVVVDHSWPKNKPRALNTALPYCVGDVVGVFDAEDEVAADLLGAIEAAFHHDHADVVQGGVQLMNLNTSWWALRNCMEYFFWFRSRLHFHADRDFIPLGGNTVFVRTSLLRAVDGWDGECLAEDCELGVRLSSLGAWVSVAYEPALTTREETPGTLTALIKQRTRWNQGFLQVLRKGMWRGLPTRRQRLLARYTLLTPFLQGITGLLVPISLVLVFVASTPASVTLVAYLPLLVVIASVTIEVVALHEFSHSYEVTVRARDYLRLVLGTLPYQWLLAAAAIRAVWRELHQERGWEKTEHINAHRPQPAFAGTAQVTDPQPMPGRLPTTSLETHR